MPMLILVSTVESFRNGSAAPIRKPKKAINAGMPSGSEVSLMPNTLVA